jgi:hypothetical protein
LQPKAALDTVPDGDVIVMDVVISVHDMPTKETIRELSDFVKKGVFQDRIWFLTVGVKGRVLTFGGIEGPEFHSMARLGPRALLARTSALSFEILREKPSEQYYALRPVLANFESRLKERGDRGRLSTSC